MYNEYISSKLNKKLKNSKKEDGDIIHSIVYIL